MAVKLYEYSSSIDEGVLCEIGVKEGDSEVDDARVLSSLSEVDSCVVGRNGCEFSQDVLDLVEGVVDVDDEFVESFQTVVEGSEGETGVYEPRKVLKWIQNREGGKVFAKSL